MGGFRGAGSSYEWGREGMSLCVISNVNTGIPENFTLSAQGFGDSPSILSAELPAPSPPSLLVAGALMSHVGLMCPSRFGDQDAF